MKNIFENYIHSISSKFSHEETSEMGYRTDFEILLKGIFDTINVKRIDHDAKARDGNKPDFVVVKFDVPILYLETKNIGISLDKIEKSEQMARYFGYSNLVLTDYVEFRFYRDGFPYQTPIKIAEYDLKKRILTPNPANYDYVANTLIDFAQKHKEPIRSAEHLAKIMGGKAQRIRDNIKQFLSNQSEKNAEILRIYESIKKQLVHDLSKDSFADMYAQTLVYGLFVARYHDETPENFTRQEARDLVPASNPFLRHFFDHIVGPDFDKRLEYIVDELCEIFSHADIPLLMKQYFKDDLWGNVHEGPDPVIHFYEDFLREYDANLRKKLGAYYTPQPVVRFIVRAVDSLLKSEFGLPSGLADTTKTESGTHKVQILDPATGTGTFLSAVIRSIYLQLKEGGQIGRWPTYVHHDLLPRIHGFEIMMAPYTIAHLKLSMAFKATGFKHFNRRLGIYLTNSLEEADNIGTLFTGFGLAESIAEESKEASSIKNDSPIMVVIGNPPYSVSSLNKGKWITDLIKEYKKELNEKNIQPLSDDYIKFIRYAEHYIEKNNFGIVAMITNNAFLDGIIHRQMRKHLLDTFDEIYILDLHGNSKKKEITPDGSKDENVFDIQQGVSISIFIRKSKYKDTIGIVKFAEIYGKRVPKFEDLNNFNIRTYSWETLELKKPYYFFRPKDFSNNTEYERGFKISELFLSYSMGIASARDNQLIRFNKQEMVVFVNDFNELEQFDFLQKYEFPDETEDWCYKNAKEDLNNASILPISYRPFDNRWTIYSGNSKGVMARPRGEVMNHLLNKNIALNLCKNIRKNYNPIYLSNFISDKSLITSLDNSYAFPLYIYLIDGTKLPNLNAEIIKQFEEIVSKIEPIKILDYIYSALHSTTYRNKYKDFLNIDFPRVPYPKDKKTFNELSKLGTELRLLHLLDSPKVNRFVTTFPIVGSETVEKAIYKNGNVYINKEQYFGKVPEVAWNFFIGGYQPAQKWLKDRKGRKLNNSEIEHYQKIIVALTETDRIMQEIDTIKFF